MTYQSGLALNTADFNFISEALNGTNGFKDGGHLVGYARESAQKLAKRKELAWYVNHLRPTCTRFVGYLNKKLPDREIQHPLLEAFSEDCDWKGNSLDVFYSNFAVEAKARGCMLLLVEMPSFQPQTLEQQLVTRFFPYLIPIKPETVRTYALNPQGKLDSVEIAAQMVIEGKLQTVIRGWDTEGWWVSMNGKIIEGSHHGLGVCPVLIFSEGDSFPYVGEFSQIAGISKRLYNLQSELDEILRGQTFSILTYQIPPEQQGQLDPTKLSEAVGVSNMLIYSGTQAPSFATPNSAPADIYLKRIAALEQNIKDIGLVIDFGSSQSAASGVALNIRFQTLNASLATFARKMEDLERRVFDLCCRWLRIKNNVTVSWSRSYELADIKSELDTLALYQAGAFPASVIKQKQAQIVQLDFANLESDELQELLDEIEQEDAETPLMESRLAVLEAQAANADPKNNAVTDTNSEGV